jgi:orotate phosphoribosyltransferase
MIASRVTLADLAAHGSHQKGHFRLSSGLHSSDYLQCALYLANPMRAERTGQEMAKAISTVMVAPALIVAPAIGGLIIGHETARAFKVPFIFTERADGKMMLRRGFGIAPNQGVVVVEDVVTTGGSTKEVIELMNARGACVVGVASLVNRSGSENPFDPLPYVSLITADFPTWPRAECPLCQRDMPIVKPGSRPVK